jgi:hypothetical protein
MHHYTIIIFYHLYMLVSVHYSNRPSLNNPHTPTNLVPFSHECGIHGTLTNNSIWNTSIHQKSKTLLRIIGVQKCSTALCSLHNRKSECQMEALIPQADFLNYSINHNNRAGREGRHTTSSICMCMYSCTCSHPYIHKKSVFIIEQQALCPHKKATYSRQHM